MLKQTSCRSKSRAWSLVEILVVVSVSAILLILIVNTTMTFIRKTSILRCASNLRNIGSAMNLYANDHNGYYPDAYNSTRVPPHKVTWMTAIATYLEYPDNAMGSPPLPRMVGVFICPDLTEDNMTKRQAGYFYNSIFLAGGGNNIKRNNLSPETFLVVEGQPKNGEGQSKANFLNSPPDRHYKGAASFLHVNGRVETLYPPFNDNDPRWTVEGK